MSGKKQVKKKPQARTARVAEATPVADSLDALLASRYHGASNIRGLHLHVRYSFRS